MIAVERCDEIMGLLEARNKANDYFMQNCNAKVNDAGILDAETHWIFYPGQEGIVEFGQEGIKIEKTSGIIESFILPDDENFELLARSSKINLEGKGNE